MGLEAHKTAPTGNVSDPGVGCTLPGDVEKYGFSPGCPGCNKLLTGSPGAAGNTHNEKRRARIYKAIDKEEAIAEGKRRLEDKGEGEDPERVRGRLEYQEHRWVSDRLPPAPGQESVQQNKATNRRTQKEAKGPKRLRPQHLHLQGHVSENLKSR